MSGINDQYYNDLFRKNQQNRQVITEINEHGESLRRADISGSGERSVSTPPRTLETFYNLLQQVVTAADNNDGTNYNLKVVEVWPTDPSVDTEFPLITTRLIQRRPLNRELKPRPMRVENDPDHPGDSVEIYSQSQNNRVEICIWSRTNKVANTLANWLEEKFFEYLWFFDWMGLRRVTYQGREKDETEVVKNELIHKRRLSFDVETSRITKKRHARIKKMKLELNIDRPDSTDLIRGS